jgi:hypothetical protein
MDVTMLLADSAQVADGKLYVLGGGIASLPAGPQPTAVALLLHVPWDRANVEHTWTLELLDEDGAPVFWDDKPITVGGNFEAGRPVGWPAGAPLTMPMAINFNALPIEGGRSYQWRLAVDGTSEEGWSLRFHVRPLAP